MMKDEVRKCTTELAAERRKVDRLTKVLGQLWDVVGKVIPGSGQLFQVLKCLNYTYSLSIFPFFLISSSAILP